VACLKIFQPQAMEYTKYVVFGIIYINEDESLIGYKMTTLTSNMAKQIGKDTKRNRDK